MSRVRAEFPREVHQLRTVCGRSVDRAFREVCEGQGAQSVERLHRVDDGSPECCEAHAPAREC